MVHKNMTTQDVLRIVTSKGTKMKMAAKWHVLNVVKGVLGESYDAVKAKMMRH